MSDIKVCNVCGNSDLNVDNLEVRNGTVVEYVSVGFCSVCGSEVRL